MFDISEEMYERGWGWFAAHMYASMHMQILATIIIVQRRGYYTLHGPIKFKTELSSEAEQDR